jgi:hypothetical protein
MGLDFIVRGMATGEWKLENGKWKMENRNPKLEAGAQLLEIHNPQPAVILIPQSREKNRRSSGTFNYRDALLRSE